MYMFQPPSTSPPWQSSVDETGRSPELLRFTKVIQLHNVTDRGRRRATCVLQGKIIVLFFPTGSGGFEESKDGYNFSSPKRGLSDDTSGEQIVNRETFLDGG